MQKGASIILEKQSIVSLQNQTARSTDIEMNLSLPSSTTKCRLRQTGNIITQKNIASQLKLWDVNSSTAKQTVSFSSVFNLTATPQSHSKGQAIKFLPFLFFLNLLFLSCCKFSFQVTSFEKIAPNGITSFFIYIRDNQHFISKWRIHKQARR